MDGPRTVWWRGLNGFARSVPDARNIGDTLVTRGVRLSLGGSIYDPANPMSTMFFNMLAVFAEFEADVLKMRTREGMAIARSRGKLKGRQPNSPPANRLSWCGCTPPAATPSPS